MSFLNGKYQNMPARDRKLLWILIGCTLLTAYLFWAAATWQKMFNTHKMVNRKADRIEKRIGNISPPALEQGISNERLAELQTAVSVQTQALRQRAKTLLPLDDSGPREQLKLELSQLAQTNMLRVSRLTAMNAELRPPMEHLDNETLRQAFEDRPQFLFTLGGHYLNLVNFLDHLPQLSYRLYVTDMTLTYVPDSEGYLNIQLTLQI